MAPKLREELLELMAVDQELRRTVVHHIGDPVLEARMREMDAKHTARLREIVAEYGWPGTSLVGAEGANAAWLLIQHADSAQEFQRSCLEIMTAAPPDEVPREQVAYLTDRIRQNAGLPQLYGTGFHWDANGVFAPLPIEDPENVDARRAAMGMTTLAEHGEYMKRLYDDVVQARKRGDGV